MTGWEPQLPPASLDPCTLAPGNLYAVAPAPFLATVASTPHHGDDHVTLRVSSSTLEAPREITVPAWFAKEFCFITDTKSAGASSPDFSKGCLYVPALGIDETPVLTMQSASPGSHWSVVKSVQPPQSPTLNIGSVDERRSFASASAGLVLAHHNAVPHDVVPALLLEHVVGPFAARVCCTMEQGFTGVTNFDGSVLPPLPNLKTLVLRDPLPADVTLPQKLKDLTFYFDEELPSLLPLTALPFLARLSLECAVPTADLRNGVVLPTVRSFVFENVDGEEGAVRVELFSKLVPNTTTLRIESHLGLAESVAVEPFTRPDVWPHTVSITAKGYITTIAKLAGARPWQTLDLTMASHVGYMRPELPDDVSVSVIGHARSVSISFDHDASVLDKVLLISSPALQDVSILTTGAGCPACVTAPHVVHLTINALDRGTSFSDVSDNPLEDPAAAIAALNAMCAACPFYATVKRVTIVLLQKVFTRQDTPSNWRCEAQEMKRQSFVVDPYYKSPRGILPQLLLRRGSNQA